MLMKLIVRSGCNKIPGSVKKINKPFLFGNKRLVDAFANTLKTLQNSKSQKEVPYSQSHMISQKLRNIMNNISKSLFWKQRSKYLANSTLNYQFPSKHLK